MRTSTDKRESFRKQLYWILWTCAGFLGLVLFLALTSVIPAVAAHGGGNTNLTCYFYGDSNAKWKIELFEVGAPYPSRQNIGYGTTFHPTWYSVVTYHRNYFIRVTKNDGEAKQTGTFWMPDNPPAELWVRTYWNKPYLGLERSW